MSKILYHVSPVHGLTMLEPRKSSHGKNYVYAIDDLVTGLLFGVKKDDFDFLMDSQAGVTEIFECYPNAFEMKYRNQSCSVYEVDDNGFLSGQTGWSPEFVSETPVAVKKECYIEDLYVYLLEKIKENKLIVHHYAEDLTYKAMISEHIIDRVIRFEVLDDHELLEHDTRFCTYYAALIKQLKEAMSGKYL